MSRHAPNYIKTHRKRAGFTQQELALLLGCSGDKRISRIERSLRKPDLEIALACQVVFGVSPHELLPSAYATVEQAVIERAHALIEALLAREPTPLIEHKVHALRAIIDRTPDAR